MRQHIFISNRDPVSAMENKFAPARQAKMALRHSFKQRTRNTWQILQRWLVFAFTWTQRMTLAEIACQCQKVGRTGATMFAFIAGFFTTFI